MSPSLRGMQLGIPTTRNGPSGPVNTVAPSIPASAVIGTQLVTTPGTWTGATTLTYQWQRNTGSWVNIGGATSANYTPVDADFGRALRVVETADGAVSANSNDTGLTAEAPAQSLGAELLTNGNFAAWTGGNPDGWTVIGEVGSDPAVSEVSGKARFFSSATSNQPRIAQSVLSGGNYYQSQFDVDAVVAGRIVSDGVASPIYDSTGTKRTINLANLLTYLIRGQGLADVTIDNASVKLITLNSQLTAPSADMRIAQFYTLPGSPVAGDQLWVLPRISDFAAGNYWLALLEYTGAQWNITLFSVAANVRTSRIAATNIGASNGLRVTMTADSIELETTANGGTNWTSRGTATNSTYQTATGVNVLWTSGFTVGNLTYA